jgi:microcystin-dependent protein
MATLPFKITNAGLALIAQVGSIGPVILTKIAVGSGTWSTSPTGSETALKTEIKKLDLTGDNPIDGKIHLTAKDDGTDSYSVREIGLFTSNNVLFAIAGGSTDYLTKASVSTLLVAVDLTVSNYPSGSITVGNTNFLFTQATETIAGIAEIATQSEVTAGTSDSLIVSPLKLKQFQFIPSGAVLPFAMSSVPAGWLKCNGQVVSRTTYASLYSAIGTTYGSGDGSTTFTLPDLRGEFIRGFDDGKGTDAGRTIGSSQTDLLKKHKHVSSNNNCTDYTNFNGTAVGKFVGHCDDGNRNPVDIGGASLTGDGNHGTQTGDGGGTSVGTVGNETRPRNIALLYCIKI